MLWFILALLFSHLIRFMSSIYGHIVLHCKDNDVRIAKGYPNGSNTFYGAWALGFKPHLALYYLPIDNKKNNCITCLCFLVLYA